MFKPCTCTRNWLQVVGNIQFYSAEIFLITCWDVVDTWNQDAKIWERLNLLGVIQIFRSAKFLIFDPHCNGICMVFLCYRRRRNNPWPPPPPQALHNFWVTSWLAGKVKSLDSRPKLWLKNAAGLWLEEFKRSLSVSRKVWRAQTFARFASDFKTKDRSQSFPKIIVWWPKIQQFR